MEQKTKIVWRKGRFIIFLNPNPDVKIYGLSNGDYYISLEFGRLSLSWSK